MKIPILTFHKIGDRSSKYWISKEALFAKLQTLHSLGYRTVTCAEFDAGVPTVEKPIILTFDDAYQNLLDAVPVLNRFGYRASCFVPTGFVGLDNRGWENYDIVPVPHLTAGQIVELDRSGVIDFQPHTVTHRNLLRANSAEAADELVQSRKSLEELLGKPRTVFCYPGGGFNDSIIELVKAAGYTSAVSCVHGLEDTDTMNRFALKRICNYSELVEAYGNPQVTPVHPARA